jgi:transposase
MTMGAVQDLELHGVQGELKVLLDDWYSQARKLWELTARIGAVLVERHRKVPDEDWSAWLAAIGLTPYAAFVFMRATKYPELMTHHQPSNLEAVARLLPQGHGEAFDAEQAALARRLHDAGLSKAKIRAHMCVSMNTLDRWIDPDAWAKRLERARRHERARVDAAARERDRRRSAALKAKGGPGALAYSQVLAAVATLDEAWRAAPLRSAERKQYGAALDELYRAKDKILTAEGIR